MAKKGVSARVTRMKPTEFKVLPIPRDRDNTDDLLDAERAARSRYSPVDHPADKTRKGSFDPSSNTAYNGNTVTGPNT
jgi:hypothetical protein